MVNNFILNQLKIAHWETALKVEALLENRTCFWKIFKQQ